MTEANSSAGHLAQTAHHELDSSASEHIYIASDDAPPDPLAKSRTVRERIELRNAVRRTRTELTLYEEGFLRAVESRNGKRGNTFGLDLHYLDPVPSIQRTIATRALYVALGSVGAATFAGFLMQFEILRPVALPIMLTAATAAVVALLIAVYRSHEKIEFVTIHGRASVLCLIANLGSIKRFRAFIPVLSRAIEESADRIGIDTSAYLRAEMREHYRLRGDGVLSSDSCADSTGRILAQFDIQL